MSKKNPEGRNGETIAQTTFRTGRPLALRRADAKQAKATRKAIAKVQANRR